MIGGVSQGKRPELTGGGLIRSLGGWGKVNELKRGRERWADDERVLGSSDFVERIVKELSVDGEKERFRAKTDVEVLWKLADKIGSSLGLSKAEIIGGNRRRGDKGHP